MGALGSNGHVSSTTVSADADVGSLGVASLVGEGFPVGVVGFDSANLTGGYAEGALIYSRGSGRLFSVQKGSVGLCAVVIATLSATPGGPVTGSTLLFVVAPATLGLAGSYTLPSLALAAITPGDSAAIIIIPGTYAEIATIAVPTGSNVSFYGVTGYQGSQVVISSSVSAQALTMSGGFVSISNINLLHTLPGFDAIDLLVGGSNTLRIFNSTIAAATSTDNAIRSSAPVTPDISASDSRFVGSILNNGVVGSSSFNGCTITRSVTVGSGVFKRCTIGDGLTITDTGSMEDTMVTRTTLGQVVLFTPSVPGKTLSINRVILRNVNDPLGTEVLIGGGVASGIVTINQLSTTSDTHPLYSWVAAQHTVITDSFSVQRKKDVSLAAASNFAVSRNADVIDVEPTTTITATMPDVSLDLDGRRVLLRNRAADQGFFLAPLGAQLIDNQTTTEPLYVPPLGVVELEADRNSGLWRRAQPRNAGNVYAVAPNGAAVPNSYPSFAAVKAVIDKDKLARTFDPTIDVYPGTYLEDVSFPYATSIRGTDSDPSATQIDGTLTMTATTGPVAVESITVLGTTNLTESGGGTITARNCQIDIRGEVAGTLGLILGGTNPSLTRVFNCEIRSNADQTGIYVQTPHTVLFYDNHAFGDQRLSIDVRACAEASDFRDNYFEGGISILSGVPARFRKNRSGDFLPGGAPPLTGIVMGQFAIIEDHLFEPAGTPSIVINNGGSPSGQMGSYRSTRACSGLAAGGPEALRGMAANRIELYAVDSNVIVDAPVHVNTAGGALILTLVNKFAFPQGAIMYFINPTAFTMTLDTAGGDSTPFSTGGTSYVIPANTSVIIIVDQLNNVYYLTSML